MAAIALRQKPVRKIGVVDSFPVSSGVAGQLLRKEADNSVERFLAANGRGNLVPPDFDRIMKALSKSQKILNLEDNWDDEGSPGYSVSTWRSVVQFIYYSSISLWFDHRISLDAPKILPGPDGSIDIHWKSPQRTLLINVPANTSEPFDYHGNNSAGQTVVGTLNTPEDSRKLLMWLMQ